MFTTNEAARARDDGAAKMIVGKPAKVAPQSLKGASGEAIQSQRQTRNEKPSGKSDLLSDTNVVNKEQRKADWAIIKEMAKYLWPQVSLRSATIDHHAEERW